MNFKRRWVINCLKGFGGSLEKEIQIKKFLIVIEIYLVVIVIYKVK